MSASVKIPASGLESPEEATLLSMASAKALEGPAGRTESTVTSPAFHAAPLYWLALGTFAVGTEGFMIAALLPGIAGDLAVSLPLLTALTGNVNRRKLLILSMAAFAGANIIAAVAPGYWFLLGARILLALSAGLYVPSANALPGVLVPPERRGRALAIVGG